jgi:hypothetical protein
MPYQILWEPEGVYKHFSGYVTSDEFYQSIDKFQGDSRFLNARYSINDFTDVEGHGITERDVKHYAAFGTGAYRINPNIKIAIVTQDPIIADLINLYIGTKIVRFPLRIFPNLLAARDWLV